MIFSKKKETGRRGPLPMTSPFLTSFGSQITHFHEHVIPDPVINCQHVPNTGSGRPGRATRRDRRPPAAGLHVQSGGQPARWKEVSAWALSCVLEIEGPREETTS
eukprot:750700-Hanusia_phi.AAC.6